MRTSFKEILKKHPDTTAYDFIRFMKNHAVELLNSSKDVRTRTLSIAYLATNTVFDYKDLKVNEIKKFLELEDLGISTVAADLSELTKKARYNLLDNDDRLLVREYILKLLTLNDIFKGDKYEYTDTKIF